MCVYVHHDVCPGDLTMKDWCRTNNILQVHSSASYASRARDVINDVTRSQGISVFKIDTSPAIFQLERRSKAQNVENVHGYPVGIFSFRDRFR